MPQSARSPASDRFAWIDLEMTGLDPETDVIIQAALIVTDHVLVPLEEYHCDIWQPDDALARMNPYVRDMHEKNGLIDRVRASRLDQGAAEQELLSRVAAFCSYPAVLCGNSVGHDKRFLDRHMPALAGYLSYRLIDVTSVKLLARAWYGDSAVFNKSSEGEHDALVDIRNSIAELRHYRQGVFRSQKS